MPSTGLQPRASILGESVWQAPAAAFLVTNRANDRNRYRYAADPSSIRDATESAANQRSEHKSAAWQRRGGASDHGGMQLAETPSFGGTLQLPMPARS
jgi:hypothetical protein